MFLGVKLEKDEKVFTFVSQTNERVKNQIFLSETEVKAYVKNNYLLLIYEYTPLGAELPLYIGGFLGFSLFYFLGLTKWLLIPAFITSLYYFNTPYFVAYMMKKGLKKIGYKGTFEKLDNKQIIKELIL